MANDMGIKITGWGPAETLNGAMKQGMNRFPKMIKAIQELAEEGYSLIAYMDGDLWGNPYDERPEPSYALISKGNHRLSVEEDGSVTCI
jgi:hypothetical protein